METKDDFHFDTKIPQIPETFEARKVRALEVLNELEEIYDKWPLDREETLKCHEDFYNHRPPALVNCSLAEVEQIFSRRKGILYAVRHKDERWSNEIEQLKRAAREEAKLTGLVKSRKEITKKLTPTGESKKAKEKLAASLGLTLEKLLDIEREAALKKFNVMIGQRKDAAVEVSGPVVQDSSSEILKQLQNKIKNAPVKTKIDPLTGKPRE